MVNGDVCNTVNLTKVLGLWWDKRDDSIIFKFNDFPSAKLVPTKRELLSFIASIYDPLGLINPFVFRLKVLFQQVCVAKVLWDVQLSGSSLQDWQSTLHDLTGCFDIVVPRWYGDFYGDVKVELHGFSDASLKGYGCCVYLRMKDSSGNCHVSLVSSKSRVAPLKTVTIPCLELQAALLLSEFLSNIYEQLKCSSHINRVFYWTDSTIALLWIKSTKFRDPYIQRRVDRIASISDTVNWYHIDSSRNPADILSRGCLLSDLSHGIWFRGPAFLSIPGSFDFAHIGANSLFHCSQDEAEGSDVVVAEGFVENSDIVHEGFQLVCLFLWSE